MNAPNRKIHLYNAKTPRRLLYMACTTSILTLPNGAKFCAVDGMKCLYGKTAMKDGTIVCALPGMGYAPSVPFTGIRTNTGTTGGGTSTTGGGTGTLPNADAAKAMLGFTNARRASAPNTNALTWNNELAALAQVRADTNLAASMNKTLSLVHGDVCLPSRGPCPNVGQNLAIEIGSSVPTAAKNSVDGWYNEKGDWDKSSRDRFLMSAGHYTQLMWRGTKEVGCAVASGTDSNGRLLVSTACDYLPPGNVQGGFQANVAAP